MAFSWGHCISFLELPQEITKNLVAQSKIKLFFQSLGVQKSQIQVLAGGVPLVGSEGKFLPCLSPGFWWLPVTPGVPWLIDA